jgi:hypothetical protein
MEIKQELVALDDQSASATALKVCLNNTSIQSRRFAGLLGYTS